MSLLRRLPTPSRKDDDEDDVFPARNSNLSEISDLLQLSSAWSVWPALQQFTALKKIAENVQLSADPRYPPGSCAVISADGVIYADPMKMLPPHQWMFILGHLLAHLGLRHQPTDDPTRAAAQEAAANNLLLSLNVAPAPDGWIEEPSGATDANYLVQHWSRRRQPIRGWHSAAGLECCDIIPPGDEKITAAQRADQWAMLLTQGLLATVPGTPFDRARYASWVTVGMSKGRQALHWFIGNYPLLSALASHFHIIEDREVVHAFGIEVAAVLAERMEIFINPDKELSLAEMHEMLHVGLLHHKREEKRDHLVWNIACDFVINAWLKDLNVGEMPKGGLYDPAYYGMSAEQVYDKLIENVQYVQTLVTFRGKGQGDMLPSGARGGPRRIGAKVIDDTLAEELMKQGIENHLNDKRGLLPAGLMEMIAPIREKAPPWKIALSRWFDARFEPSLPVRTFVRPSRRQSSTPDIPRPRYALPQIPDGSGVFGVVLDTSGSMHAQLLGRGLGAIAALARRHRIPKVRLIFCDTQPHDEGFVALERLEQPMPVRGRGGTKLQPGIDALVAAEDFPKDAPILIITDGECDVLEIKRDHAYLIPEGKRLPFNPSGTLFRLS
jgi:predicted metal-dependent peptidase